MLIVSFPDYKGSIFKPEKLHLLKISVWILLKFVEAETFKVAKCYLEDKSCYKQSSLRRQKYKVYVEADFKDNV